jgi:DHA1 family bicyclomycin/chloramphenicol resistance-like MFS transporter
MATAPMIGGYLNYQYGFRSNFLAIAVCVAASLFCSVFLFKEPLPIEKRIPLNLEGTFQNFKKTLLSGPFWKLTLIISLLFTGYLGFLATTSILFVVDMGVPKKVFPFLQGSLLLAYVCASLSCNKALQRFGTNKTREYGLYCILLSSFLMIVVTLFFPNPYLLTVAMLPFTFGLMYVQTPYFSDCMNIFPEIKGIVASLITSIRLLVTAALIGIASSYYNGTVIPTTILVLTTAFISTYLYYSYEKKKIALSA